MQRAAYAVFSLLSLYLVWIHLLQMGSQNAFGECLEMNMVMGISAFLVLSCFSFAIASGLFGRIGKCHY